MNSNIDTSKILQKYREIAFRTLKLNLPELSDEEILNGINHSIQNRLVEGKATIDNNYKHKSVNTTLLQLSDYILTREPIITPYGVMFKKHGLVDNPFLGFINKFLEDRDSYKKKMLELEDKGLRGSEDYENYNLLQLLAKIDANGLYGAFGTSSCFFYNLYVAGSITMQGRALISTASLFFEMFLNNNVKFTSMNEIITFIDNVLQETPNRKYSDFKILDRNITVEDCFTALISNCGFDFVPTDKQLNIIWAMLSRVTREDLNRLYYKNNLFAFIENKYMTDFVINMLKKLSKPYLNPNEYDEEIEQEQKEFLSILMEYVYYPYLLIDRMDRYTNMIRKTVIITDTDSSIISLDGWYRFILDKIKDEDIPIARREYDIVKYVNDEKQDKDNLELINEVDKEIVKDYNFYNDEVIEIEREKKRTNLIPQDSLRHSIINLLANPLGTMVNDYMIKFVELDNANLVGDNPKCIIRMKNEFLFKRIYLYYGKKMYATIQEVREGILLKNGGVIDIKGLNMKKSETNKTTRERLTKIMNDDILNTSKIDQVKIIKELAIFENDIYNSLISGDKNYYKPVKVSSIVKYKNPYSIQGITASIAWNILKDESSEVLDLYEMNSIDIVKVSIDKKSIEKVTDKEHKLKLETLLKEPCFKGKVTSLGIPRNEKIPSWLVQFIKFDTIINDNIKKLPLEPIGIYTHHDKNNYSNILKI